MKRISEQEINKLIEDFDLVALVQSRGVELTKNDRKWQGRCPFHKDKQKSFVITPAKKTYQCSSCGEHGNAVHFVEKFDGVSFRHAFDLIKIGGDAVFIPPKGSTKRPSKLRLDCPFDPELGSSAFLEQITEFYADNLQQSEAAIDYLKSRGLESAVETFQIGFANRSMGLRLPPKDRVLGVKLRNKLTELGVYRASGHEHLNGCITVPIRNSQGDIVQLYGRRIESRAPKNKRHQYTSQTETGIFNATALKQRQIYLTQGIIDALTFYANGYENVTCTLTSEHFSEELYQAIIEHKIETVHLAFNSNKQGEQFTHQVSHKLQSIGIQCYQVKFPWGSDANAYAVEQGNEVLHQAIRNATWLEGNTAQQIQGHTQPLPSFKQVPDAPQLVLVDPVPEPVTNFTQQGEYYHYEQSERSYRIGGLHKNNSMEVMKITLRISHQGLLHVDSIDLYKDTDRRKYIERASEETMLEKLLIKRDLGKLMLALEQELEARLAKPIQEVEEYEMTNVEGEEALAFLKEPKLLDRIATAYESAGLVGETTNKLAAFLACMSRKLRKPLAVIIQSSSAAGKSTLMEAVLSFFPQEEQMKYSAMTGQSLYYMGESNIKHKILAIVEEEGAEKASYALKLLQSEGELTIASTGKNLQSGRMETQEYHVEGPVALLLTTTSIDIDEELMNRCLVLTVDESNQQTERIHQLQREARTLEGILAAEQRNEVIALMQNVQRLIKPIRIVNPYARYLTFTNGSTRTRRDHEKYLTLIDSIALLHQYQREPIKHVIDNGSQKREITMLSVILEDIELANQIAPIVLGRSLDELAPQTRRLLESLKNIVSAKLKDSPELDTQSVFITRRELREQTGWSQTLIRKHLSHLLELDYIRQRGGRNGVVIQYELLSSLETDNSNDHVGLIDLSKLKDLIALQSPPCPKTPLPSPELAQVTVPAENL
ncbi:MAG: CHC2 zinc finger domain-containing protein [Akkermansiaceae bacterium]